DVFAGKKSAQIREILISESAWEEMTCLFAPSLVFGADLSTEYLNERLTAWVLFLITIPFLRIV
ncbi:MAG: hypothetical protein E7H29_16510, partial [Enterobacter sp.]|nr:hypothetical protein [Enterobacter sp.]